MTPSPYTPIFPPFKPHLSITYTNPLPVLEAIHPVIRTNPVTGWKSIFALGHHVQRINGLTELESDALLKWFLRLVVDNHDLQVRHRWQNANDLAIWGESLLY
jgi:alpha-ketoglutarate-dependent taurine dioxygenase